MGTKKIAPHTNKNYDYQEFSFDAIEWIDTYKNNITGKGTTVAVIDTGCKVDHKDLNNNIAGTYNAVDGTTDVTDDNGHGTHVTGIIAAVDNSIGVVGIAPDTKVYVIKAQSDDGYLYDSAIIRGLKKCVSLGNISAINMSFGGYFTDQDMEDALQKCENAGIVCVSAAGNESTKKPIYPAAYGIGIRVASYDPFTKELSYFSNYGPNNCDIAAPGDEIYSTFVYNNKDSYEFLSGTSMATPYVTGLVALVCSNNKVSKNAKGASFVKNLILTNNDGIEYKYGKHSVKGGINVQKIFKPRKIKTPDKPVITVKTQKDTKQQIVTVEGTGTIYYTTDGTDPSIYSKKYTTKIHLDKSGTYTFKAICANKRSYSKTVSETISINKDVIPESSLKSIELYINDKGTKTVTKGKLYTIKVKNDGNAITNNRFKWSCSNTNVATVNSKGKITVKDNAKKGDKFTISAKIGDYTKKLALTVN